MDMRQFALYLILLVGIVACGKDKFETKPKLEIKDYSSKNIFPRPAGLPEEELRIRLNFFDKEGVNIHLTEQKYNRTLIY